MSVCRFVVRRCPRSRLEIRPSPCRLFPPKGTPKVVTKTRNGMFYSSRRRPSTVGGDAGPARVLSNCHFSQSVLEGAREKGKGRGGAECGKESKLRRFDICFVHPRLSARLSEVKEEKGGGAKRAVMFGRFTNWCLFELRRCLHRYSIDECVSTADRRDY